MVETSKEVLEVRLEHPTHALARNDFIERRQGVVRPEARAPAKGYGQKILLVDGGQQVRRGPLQGAVGNRRHPERALGGLSRLRNPHPAYCRWLIPALMDGVHHLVNPGTKGLHRLGLRYAIRARRRGGRNMMQCPPHGLRREVMGQGRKAKGRFLARFLCYAFQFG